MNNPYEKLPFDLYIDIENEVERKLSEFYNNNPNISEKLTNEEKETIKEWIYTTTSFEFYRLYGITENELKEYFRENNININNKLPQFKDIKIRK